MATHLFPPPNGLPERPSRAASGTRVAHFSVVVSLGVDRTRLHLSGELDLAAVPHLNDCFEKACANANSVVVFDLNELTYCDSSGIRALLQAAARCAKDGTDMQVVGVRGVVRRVIQLTHTADSLNVIDIE